MLTEFREGILRTLVNEHKRTSADRIKRNQLTQLFGVFADKDSTPTLNALEALSACGYLNIYSPYGRTRDVQTIMLTPHGKYYFSLRRMQLDQEAAESLKRKEELRIAELKERKAVRRSWWQLIASALLAAILAIAGGLAIAYFTGLFGLVPAP